MAQNQPRDLTPDDARLLQELEDGYFGLLKQRELLRRRTRYPVFDYEYKDRRVLYEHVNGQVLKNRPIDYLEFGVASGNSMRQWLQINDREDSRFYGFDSFQGLPEDWRVGQKSQGDFATGGIPPDIQDPRLTFVPGWFNQTLRPFLQDFAPRSQLVLHMDADLYSSTLYVLTTLDPVLPKGTVLVMDDFNAVDDFAALHHYCRAFSREWIVLAARRDHGKLALALR
jgi:hypothetical protein